MINLFLAIALEARYRGAVEVLDLLGMPLPFAGREDWLRALAGAPG